MVDCPRRQTPPKEGLLGLLEYLDALSSCRAGSTPRYVSSTKARKDLSGLPRLRPLLNVIGGSQAPLYPAEAPMVLHNARVANRRKT